MMTNRVMAVAIYNHRGLEVINGSVKDVAVRGEAIEKQGAKLVECVVTNDKGVYSRARLKARLVELRDYAKHIRNFEIYGKDKYTPKTYKQTLDCMVSYQATLCKQVGLLYSRLLSLGIEYDDELAIVCYNFRNSL